MDAIRLIDAVGFPVAALVLVTSAFLSRRIVTRDEFDAIRTRCEHLEAELRRTREDLRRDNELLARTMERLAASRESDHS